MTRWRAASTFPMQCRLAVPLKKMVRSCRCATRYVSRPAFNRRASSTLRAGRISSFDRLFASACSRKAFKNRALMKICLVTAFPPSGRQLNEYGFHLARELQRNPLVNLTILGDQLTNYEWATDKDGKPLSSGERRELAGFHVVRCWESNSLAAPRNLASTVRRLQPDIVWFNLVYSTFATQEHPVAAFAGLCTPALTRAMGYFTHDTLHHILEHVDFAGAGVKRERTMRLGSELATRALLRANSVSVLLSTYR